MKNKLRMALFSTLSIYIYGSVAYAEETNIFNSTTLSQPFIMSLIAPHSVLLAETEHIETTGLYETPEELLLTILQPEIDNYVKQQYGDKIVWSEPKIANLKMFRERAWQGGKIYHELRLYIKIEKRGQTDCSYGLDFISLKIYPEKMKLGNGMELLEYRHVADFYR